MMTRIPDLHRMLGYHDKPDYPPTFRKGQWVRGSLTRDTRYKIYHVVWRCNPRTLQQEWGYELRSRTSRRKHIISEFNMLILNPRRRCRIQRFKNKQ